MSIFGKLEKAKQHVADILYAGNDAFFHDGYIYILCIT